MSKKIIKHNTVNNNYKTIKTIKNSISEVFESVMSGTTGIAVFVLLVIFPLYTHDMYFDILSARYLFFKVLVVLLMILAIGICFLHMLIERDNNTTDKEGGFFTRILNEIRIENFNKHIVVTDIFFLLMVIGCSFSTLFSEKQEESFFGTSGRYQGLECWLLYFVLYIIVSRGYKYKKYYLNCAIFSGVFASIWGITDYFRMDIFGFLRGVSEGQVSMFMSSVGNLNTFTNYTTMIFAVSAGLFMIEKNRIIALLYGLASLFTCLGSIYGLSDNTLLAFAAFYIACPFLLIKDKRSVVRFIILAFILFLSISIKYWTSLFGFRTIWGNSIFMELGRIPAIRYLTFVFLIFAIVVFLMFTKGNIKDTNVLDEPAPKFILRAWTIFCLVSFAFVIFIFYDVNVSKRFIETWRKIPSYNQLEFNDYWGTHRGHNWRIGVENFIKFNPFKKLFGFGPDTYLVVSERSHYREMVDRFGEVYDSAHNEYMQYLVCEGLVGLVSYLGIFISAVRYGIIMIKENREYAVIALAVISYLVQAVVNIAIPITTPIFFTFAYMLVAGYINNRKEKVMS